MNLYFPTEGLVNLIQSYSNTVREIKGPEALSVSRWAAASLRGNVDCNIIFYF